MSIRQSKCQRKCQRTYEIVVGKCEVGWLVLYGGMYSSFVMYVMW
jgi:hypothetical protein